MAGEDTFDHYGYRIQVRATGAGWAACVYPPGSETMLMEKPTTGRRDRRERVVAEAMAIVDRLRETTG